MYIYEYLQRMQMQHFAERPPLMNDGLSFPQRGLM